MSNGLEIKLLPLEVQKTFRVLSSFEDTADTHCAFKLGLINNHFITEMGRKSFTPMNTAIGLDILLEISRNHWVIS